MSSVIPLHSSVRSQSGPATPPSRAAFLEKAEDEEIIKKTFLSQKPDSKNVWAPLWVLAVMMVLSMIYWQDPTGWGSQLAASSDLVFKQHQYWRLLTSLGVHANIEHFGSNALFFVGLGFLLRNYFGWMAFPVLSIVGGALTHALTLSYYSWIYSSDTVLLGASGIVYVMAAFWLTQFLGIERNLSFTRRILSAAGFTLILLFPTQYEPTTSYAAHGIGFFVGLLIAYPFFLFKRNYYRSFEVLQFPEPEVIHVEGSAEDCSDTYYY